MLHHPSTLLRCIQPCPFCQMCIRDRDNLALAIVKLNYLGFHLVANLYNSSKIYVRLICVLVSDVYKRQGMYTPSAAERLGR